MIQGWQKSQFFQKNQRIFLFKSDFFNLNQIMIYIRIFNLFLGYCSYNCHNYINNLAKQVGNQARQFLIVYLKVTND